MNISIIGDDADMELLDILMKVLLLDYTGEESLLPEIYEVFGSDYFIKFMDVFAGKSFSIPLHNELEEAVMKADIFYRLNGIKSKDEYDQVQALSRRYEVNSERVRLIYNRLSVSISKMDQG